MTVLDPASLLDAGYVIDTRGLEALALKLADRANGGAQGIYRVGVVTAFDTSAWEATVLLADSTIAIPGVPHLQGYRLQANDVVVLALLGPGYAVIGSASASARSGKRYRLGVVQRTLWDSVPPATNMPNDGIVRRVYTTGWVGVPATAVLVSFQCRFSGRSASNAAGYYHLQGLFSSSGSTGYVDSHRGHNGGDAYTPFDATLLGTWDALPYRGESFALGGDGVADSGGATIVTKNGSGQATFYGHIDT